MWWGRGSSSSFKCSGCRIGNNIVFLLPCCAILINSVDYLRCNTTLMFLVGILDLNWPLWAALVCSSGFARCSLYTLRKTFYFSERAWRGMYGVCHNPWQNRSTSSYCQHLQSSTSFLISMCSHQTVVSVDLPFLQLADTEGRCRIL